MINPNLISLITAFSTLVCIYVTLRTFQKNVEKSFEKRVRQRVLFETKVSSQLDVLGEKFDKLEERMLFLERNQR